MKVVNFGPNKDMAIFPIDVRRIIFSYLPLKLASKVAHLGRQSNDVLSGKDQTLANWQTRYQLRYNQPLPVGTPLRALCNMNTSTSIEKLAANCHYMVAAGYDHDEVSVDMLPFFSVSRLLHVAAKNSDWALCRRLIKGVTKGTVYGVTMDLLVTADQKVLVEQLLPFCRSSITVNAKICSVEMANLLLRSSVNPTVVLFYLIGRDLSAEEFPLQENNSVTGISYTLGQVKRYQTSAGFDSHDFGRYNPLIKNQRDDTPLVQALYFLSPVNINQNAFHFADGLSTDYFLFNTATQIFGVDRARAVLQMYQPTGGHQVTMLLQLVLGLLTPEMLEQNYFSATNAACLAEILLARHEWDLALGMIKPYGSSLPPLFVADKEAAIFCLIHLPKLKLDLTLVMDTDIAHLAQNSQQ